MDFYKIYNPITADPFRKSGEYAEFAPCAALRPYIRCFWGSVTPYRNDGLPTGGSFGIVTPDTCMDVIFDINHTDGNSSALFCGIDDRSFTFENQPGAGGTLSTFGIRFYAWSAVLFAEESMSGARNARVDAEAYFCGLKKYLEPRLYEITHISDRIALAEKYFMGRLGFARENAVLEQAMGCILRHRGSIRIKELSYDTGVCERRLQRIFDEYIGISPKKTAELVRYQYLWNELVYGRDPEIQDLVYRFGYTDQSHLLRDFKRFHAMTPAQARRRAFDGIG